MKLEIGDETFEISAEPQESRFTVSHDGKVIGLVDYVDRPGQAVRTFTHTEVSPRFGGRGIAAHLVRFALESTIEHGLTFTSACSYVTDFVSKNPEFADSRA